MQFDLSQWSTLALLIIFIWLTALSVIFYRLLRHYQRLTKGITPTDLKSVLEKLLTGFESQAKKNEVLAKELEKLAKEGLNYIQKVGLVRFNPFAETGGNQSFSLAVLDEHDNGFVISSLHSREATRLYAKSVKKGQPVDFKFSTEEKQAIKKAKKIK